MAQPSAVDGGTGIKHIRLLLNDHSGQTRVVLVPRRRLDAILQEGVGISSTFAIFNAADHPISTEDITVAVGGIVLMPDASTMTALPYAPEHAAVAVDMQQRDGSPFAACPRDFLRRQVQRLADAGFSAQVAQEIEFFFLPPEPATQPLAPLYQAPYYGAVALQHIGPVLCAIVEALDQQGMGVMQYHPEAGNGQCEIALEHADPLTAADRQLLVRETIRSVARQHGTRATLAPKPFTDDIGSGAHVHVSLWDAAGRNAFHDPADPHGLSRTAHQFIAGLLAHLPGLVALTCPTVNSYARLAPDMWSSAFTSWGYQNREATVRAVRGRQGTDDCSTNLELKPVDSSCNPYLALGGILAAGLDGIERGLVPPEPLTKPPSMLSEQERASGGIRRLPQSLADALDELERDEVLMSALGPVRGRAYLALKRDEHDYYSAQDAELVLEQHRIRF